MAFARMKELVSDFVFATRRLLASRGFTAFAIATLALGIGATTAIYSVIYAAALRPPDIRDVHRVLNVYHSNPEIGFRPGAISFSRADYEDLKVSQTVFSEITAWARFRHTIVGRGTAEFVHGELVGGEYFSLLGVNASLGRTIQPADDRPGAPPIIVLGDRLWQQRFGADPAIVGKTVTVNGHLFEVVGVAPSAFRGVDMPNVVPTAAWIPLSAAGIVSSPGMIFTARSSGRDARWLMVKGRLAPGRTVSEARAEMAALGQRLDLAYPLGTPLDGRIGSRPDAGRQWHVIPAADVLMHESVHQIAKPMIGTVLAAVGLVLLVACTNLANLLLGRGAARRQEMAVRLALGASRWRLIREQLVESVLLAAAGGVAALVVARALTVYVLSGTIQMGLGATIQFSPEQHPSVIGVAIGATVLALLVFGLIPALHVSRADVRDALATDSGSAAVPRWRGRRNLISVQVGISVVLVALAALCTQQIAATARRDLGFDLDRLALVRLDFQLQKYDEVRARHTLQAVLDLAGRQPGVESVALSSGLPTGMGTPGARLTTLDRPFVADRVHGTGAELLVSTPDIFRTLGVPIRFGRPFDERDSQAALPVVVLSELAANALFGSSHDVPGRQVLVQRRRLADEDEPPVVTRTVIGISADTDVGSAGRREQGIIFVPLAQHYEPAVTVMARAAGDPTPIVTVLRTLITRVDPQLAIFDAGTGSALGGAGNLPLRIAASAAGLLGVLALVLAMTGLYGVVSSIVTRRTREMGLRMALGAEREHLVRMVMVDGVRPVITGLVIGLATCVIARMALRPVFTRLIPAADPLVLLFVPVLFLAAALAACYFPARRAANVDPNVALRHL